VSGPGVPPVTSIGGEPLDPSVDLVRVVARGLAVAVLAGSGTAGLVLALVRVALRNAPPADVPRTGPEFYLLVFGILGAMGVAAAVAWRRLAPISSPWRRSVFAMIAGFTTFVSALLATPLHFYLGQPGLLAASTLALALAFALGRR